MNDPDPLPISEGAEIHAELDRRPAQPRTTAIESGAAGGVGPSWRFQFTIAVMTVAGTRVYEVVVHHRGPVRDDRCVVARFRNLDDARDSVPVLGDGWMRSYCVPPEENGEWRIESCPN